MSRATVQSYLPYKKGIYKANEISLNAERIHVFRNRQQAIKNLLSDMSEETLWEAVVAFQKYPFHTVSGLTFDYELKRGRNGDYNKELIVSRRKESKSVVWSSIRLAFLNALMLQDVLIDRPKVLGDIRGISYIYPMLFRFGIIKVPERAAAKMNLKRPAPKSERLGSDNDGMEIQK